MKIGDYNSIIYSYLVDSEICNTVSYTHLDVYKRQAVAHLAKLKPTPEQYYNLAVKIGKDVPYFLVNKPAVYNLNKQEVTPIKFKHNPQVLLIIHPDIYEKENVVKDFLDYGESLQKPLEKVVELAESGSLRELGSVLFNDFSETIIKHTPALRTVLNDRCV